MIKQNYVINNVIVKKFKMTLNIENTFKLLYNSGVY